MQADSHALYDWVKQLFQYGAGMARISLRFVRGIWLTTAAALLGGVFYLTWHIDAHWFWSVSYGIVAIAPVIVLTYYHWMLTGLTRAPEHLGAMRETLIRFQREHPEETKKVIQHKISAIGRWRTYQLIGRVVKDVFKGAGEVGSLVGYFKILASMANPAFWIILVISLVLALVFSGCMVVLLSILLMFG